jgi:hypothetical protein
MSATYNWAYRPGITNKYGFTVSAGADNVRPSGWCYVALFGNDITGNGSRQYPYRTITKAISISGNITIVLGSGVYRELAIISTSNNYNIVGDGDVIIDISYSGAMFSGNVFGINFYNLQIRGAGNSYVATAAFIDNQALKDVFFNGAYTANTDNTNAQMVNCIVFNYSGILAIGRNADYPNNVANSTFINCNNVQLAQNTNSSTTFPNNCIFSNCNISATLVSEFAKVKYSLFFQCNFKLTSGLSNGGVLYPAIPAGYTYYSTIIDLQNAYSGLYSTLSFTGCLISDPLFNNRDIGDFTLSFNSPAKNLSYFGTYIGAKSIAYPISINTTESDGTFEFSSAVNVNIANNSITLTDPTLDAQINTNVIINSSGREITNFLCYGFNADRNGQYIDSIADLDTIVKNAGDTLTIPASYLVESGAISYNSLSYTAGSRITTITGQSTFTSASGGTLREILEAPQRHTIMARFSDGGAAISAGTTLIIDYYYYIQLGAITYNSIVYTAGKIFKAIDTNAFSGSGSVIIAFSTENYQHYESGIKPTSNNAGDSRTGPIVRGNGDPAYVRGGLSVQEFPINAKFIQIKYYIRANNLKP